MSQFTVLGATGFVGSHVEARLLRDGFSVYSPTRDETLAGRDLGHVIYCIGVTADFRTKPLDTVEAHVCRLVELLRRSKLESLTYLSSARVYSGNLSSGVVASEDAELVVQPANNDCLYNISKILGESVVLAAFEQARVLRLSNVYGLDTDSENFLPSVIKAALTEKRVALRTSLESAKDYVSLDDVVDVIPAIALSGRDRVYNIASGANTTNSEIVGLLQRETGCTVSVASDARTVLFPVIDTRRVCGEFDFRPRNLLDDLPMLLAKYSERL